MIHYNIKTVTPIMNIVDMTMLHIGTMSPVSLGAKTFRWCAIVGVESPLVLFDSNYPCFHLPINPNSKHASRTPIELAPTTHNQSTRSITSFQKLQQPHSISNMVNSYCSYLSW